MAGDRPAAPRGRVVVRRQRHQRARDPGGGAGRGGAGRRSRRPAGRRRRWCRCWSRPAARRRCGRRRDRLRAHLIARPELTLLDVGFSLATDAGAAASTARWWSATDRGDAAGAGSARWPRGEPAPDGRWTGRVVGGKAVFVFPGRARSGRGWRVELLDVVAGVRGARSRRAARRCRRTWTGRWTDVLRGAPGAPSLERVDVVQPALFAVMVSLAALWRSYGVRAGRGGRALAGRDRGGVRGGCAVAGGRRAGGGAAQPRAARAAGRAGRDGVGRRCRSTQVEERIAAVRRAGVGRGGQRPGDGGGLRRAGGARRAARRRASADGVRARRMPVDYASHSAHVEAIEDELLASAWRRSRRGPGRVPFYSTVTGGFLDTAELDAGVLVPQPARHGRLRAGGRGR